MTTLLELNDFKDYVKLNPSLDIGDLKHYINLAQDKYIYPILCRQTYDDLKTAFDAGTLTEAQTNLLAEIKPALVFRAYQMFVNHSSLINTPNGLKVAEDVEGTSAPLSADRRAELVQEAKSSAALYENMLLTYLKINKDTYTDWAASDCYCKETTKANYLQGVKANKSVKTLTPLRLKYEK